MMALPRKRADHHQAEVDDGAAEKKGGQNNEREGDGYPHQVRGRPRELLELNGEYLLPREA
jgi:hypothetical protein